MGRVDLGELLAPALFDLGPLLLAFEPQVDLGQECGGFLLSVGSEVEVVGGQVRRYVYLWTGGVGVSMPSSFMRWISARASANATGSTYLT